MCYMQRDCKIWILLCRLKNYWFILHLHMMCCPRPALLMISCQGKMRVAWPILSHCDTKYHPWFDLHQLHFNFLYRLIHSQLIKCVGDCQIRISMVGKCIGTQQQMFHSLGDKCKPPMQSSFHMRTWPPHSHLGGGLRPITGGVLCDVWCVMCDVW